MAHAPPRQKIKLYLSMFFFIPEEFQSFVGRLPTHYAVNTSVVEHLWRMDGGLLQRYRQLETTSGLLLDKARRAANKLFSLSKRCRHRPRIVLQRERYRVFLGGSLTQRSPLKYLVSYLCNWFMHCTRKKCTFRETKAERFWKETRSADGRNWVSPGKTRIKDSWTTGSSLLQYN